MGGLRKHMPAVAYTYLIGCLAISGIFLSGFWSKEEIFSGLYEHKQYALLIITMSVAGLTAFYMFRTYFLTFEGEYRGHAHPHNASKIITLPLILLSIPSAIVGFTLCGKFGLPSFDMFINNIPETIHSEECLLIPIVSLLLALGGVGLAWVLYTEKVRQLLKINLNSFIIRIKPVYNFSTNLWYIDATYKRFVKYVILPVSELLSAFDKYIVDGIVNLIAAIASINGWILRLFQNGNIQTYATILLGGLVVLTFMFTIYSLF